MKHQVFICHASEDKAIADAVCAILEENRVPCWIAPRDILPAEDYGQAIVESISSSRLVVFVFSAHANASPHIKRELECAVSHGIAILPFRIEDVIPSESLQYYLGGIHWLDALTTPLEAHLQHLAGTVRVLLDRDEHAPSGRQAAPQHAPPPVPPPPPQAPPPAPPPTSPLPLVPTVAVTGPAGSRAPSRRAWLIGLAGVVAVVSALGIAALLSGGGDADRGDVASTTTTSATTTVTTVTTEAPDVTGSDDLAIAQQSCALLDPADVEAVYGSGADPGTPNASDGYCDFGSGFEAVKIYQEAATEADLRAFREYAEAGTVDLPDLGGGAYQEPNGSVTVLDATRGIILVLITGGSSPADYQRLVEIATLIVAG